jgi:hypothetical protein
MATLKLDEGMKILVDIARQELEVQAKSLDKHEYHFGIRFLSDSMVQEKLKQGKGIMQALKELAEEDYRSL